MNVLDEEKAAAVLIEAAYSGDEEAAKKFGVSERTITRYRKRLQHDPKLSVIVGKVSKKSSEQWINGVNAAIMAGAEFLTRAALDLDSGDPAAVAVIANCTRSLAEIATMREVLIARLAQYRDPD